MAYRGAYKLGTRVMYRDGYVRIKTEDGMKSFSRFKMGLKQEITNEHRVVHLDNTLRGTNPDAFDDYSNLIVVKVRTTKWVKLKSSTVLWKPRAVVKDIKQLVLQ